MRYLIAFCTLWLVVQQTTAQTQNYFQQQVNYTIDVQLNDSTHALIGTIEMDYTNNSPNALREIYIHLWGNAYANKETPFAEQQIRNDSKKFYFAKQEDLGGFSGINFLVDGKSVTVRDWENQGEIVVLTLPKPLLSGESVTISTPFQLDIPASFSRLGHVGKSYQMTQWYPKPAVYDIRGWHPMPYLDQGEFYSEFGNYDVRITLPDNYVVGATGTLQTKSEYDFLLERVAATKAFFKGEETELTRNDFPKASKKMKTLRYTAENVHDFAFFADREFKVLKDSVILESGKQIDTWAMFANQETDLWKQATKYLNRSVKFYSDMVGEYPYPQATAVQSALSAGAGMEYPMITVIGLSRTDKSLDNVITHEVGHNWFYGILASNERRYAWMDEGVNSYYENRYMTKFYDDSSLPLPAFLRGDSELELNELAYLLQARRHEDQAPNTPSEEFTSLNYGVSAYIKPAIVFAHLEAYVGMEAMDEAMQIYYDQWKFKHPDPSDLRSSLEKSLDRDLSWVFDDMLSTTKQMDYALQIVDVRGKSLEIKVKNKGEITAPIPISAIKNGEVVETRWYDGISDEQVVSFPKVRYDDLVIDVERQTLEVDRRDNRLRNPKPDINFGVQLEDDKERTISIAPALGWNNYDGFMLGLAVHNMSLPFRNLELAVAPMFAFNSERLTGTGGIQYHIYPKVKALERVTLGLNGRTFSYADSGDLDEQFYFNKWSPSVNIRFAKKTSNSFWSQQLSYRYVSIDRNIAILSDLAGSGDDVFFDVFNYGINQLTYELENSNALTPALLSATLEQSGSYTKLFASYEQSFPYQKENKSLTIRVFGGTFFNFDAAEATRSLLRPSFLLGGNTSGTFQEDYLFDEFLLGRTETSGFLSQQVFQKDAQFRTLTSVGTTANWMLSSNIRSTLPKPVPLDIFVDLAYSNPESGEGNFFYSSGLVLPLIGSVLEIYVPLLESDAIEANHKAQGREGLLERITFRFDLLRFNPLKLRDNLNLGQ